jgi:C4-dicarboxylate-specific signal transduction histidine kinase
VLTNLVQNATLHAFSGRTQGCLRISASEMAGSIELRVEDDGKGMDSNTLAHIFEPFFTTRLGQGGSGLGLSVSLNIATGMLGGSRLPAPSWDRVAASLRFPTVAPEFARANTSYAVPGNGQQT